MLGSREQPSLVRLYPHAGHEIVSADKAEAFGVALPTLTADTKATRRTVVPDFGCVRNPTDTTGQVLKSSETVARCVEEFLADSGSQRSSSPSSSPLAWQARPWSSRSGSSRAPLISRSSSSSMDEHLAGREVVLRNRTVGWRTAFADAGGGPPQAQAGHLHENRQLRRDCERRGIAYPEDIDCDGSARRSMHAARA